MIEVCQKFKLSHGEYRRDSYWIHCSLPYINYIYENLHKCEISLYVDNSVLYVGNKICDAIVEKLNSDLEQIANWLDENNLVVNLNKIKTECVLYSTHQITSTSNHKLRSTNHRSKITDSEVYKYFGVKMDINLTFSDHIK